jgi:hypothetical protein
MNQLSIHHFSWGILNFKSGVIEKLNVIAIKVAITF